MNLNNKKVFISPHTPRTTMFEKDLKRKFKNVIILGFIDKEKTGTNIFKIEEVSDKEFDFILILSLNHVNSIYKDYKLYATKNKLIQVNILNNKYIYLNRYTILFKDLKRVPDLVKEELVKICVRIFSSYTKKRIIFLSKSFVSTNNKALYIECIHKKLDVVILTENKEQLKELKKLNLPSSNLNTLLGYYYLATAKLIIQDQGDSNYLLNKLNNQQKTLQMWHGIPLKKLNLINYTYDYYVGTSKYVEETSMNKVIRAKNYFDYGYPRNDLLLKENHNENDLLFVDKELYKIAREHKVIVYMPTHREATKDKKSLIPIDFKKLNTFMKESKSYFIMKLHPFMIRFYKELTSFSDYSNIKFYSGDGDIYPLLKYADILITDYSSIFFDFWFVNKPTIFYTYDYEEYSSNMNGFLYDFEEVAIGPKVINQNQLEKEIFNIFQGTDNFKTQRETLLSKFFRYKDSNSSKRIINTLLT